MKFIFAHVASTDDLLRENVESVENSGVNGMHVLRRDRDRIILTARSRHYPLLLLEIIRSVNNRKERLVNSQHAPHDPFSLQDL